MKKKIAIGITSLGLVLLLTGCDGNVTRDIRHAGYNLTSNTFSCEDIVVESNENVILDKISYLNSSFALTEKGHLYEISLSQPYSNNQNCKKIAFSQKVIALMDGSILKGEDKKLYYSPGTSNATPLTEVTINDNSYQIYNLLLSSDAVKKVVTVNQNQGLYYVLETDGNVYSYKLARAGYNSPYTLAERKIVYAKEKYGTIIDFNYSESNQKEIYIKSATELYRMKASNEKECTKYADVTCNYSLQKDEALSEYLNDKILYHGSTMIITTYGKEFTIN